MNDKKGLELAKQIIEFCKTQDRCFNCIFGIDHGEYMGCEIGGEYIDMRNIESRYEAKRKKGGYVV